MLYDLGLTKQPGTQVESIFKEIFHDILEIPYSSPSDFMIKSWAKYLGFDKRSNNLNGAVFENLIGILLIREGLTPFYIQAELSFVPNAKFDLLIYTNEVGPICLSLKTTLRERWKQADLESFALKNVHRKSLCFLVTLSESEGRNVKTKIQEGGTLGLDDVVLADKNDLDNLMLKLKKLTIIKAPKLNTILNENNIIN